MLWSGRGTPRELKTLVLVLKFTIFRNTFVFSLQPLFNLPYLQVFFFIVIVIMTVSLCLIKGLRVVREWLEINNMSYKDEQKNRKTEKIEKITEKTDRFGFGFISLKPKKPNRTSTGKNQAKPVWTDFCPKKPNRTETDRFEPVLVYFLKKILVWFFIFIKTEANRKWSPLMSHDPPCNSW